MRGVRFKDEDEEEDNHLTTTEDKTPKKKKRVSWIACPEEKEKEKGEVCVSGSESSDGEWLDPGVLALIDVGVVNCCHRYQIGWYLLLVMVFFVVIFIFSSFRTHHLPLAT